MEAQTICILGRQPALGLAELESIYGSDAVRPVSLYAAALKRPPETVSINRLGGSQRVAKLLGFIPAVTWQEIHKYLITNLAHRVERTSEGKLKVGTSTYGIRVEPGRLTATGLEFKKVLRSHGHSVRIVPSKSLALNTAQVIHNQLCKENGLELLLIADGQRTLLAQTVAVQDIQAYAMRDQARPKRDARVGMLPPKLAQIIINLAQPALGSTILDPFCGTGVVLQEAVLAGYTAYGTDIEPRMIEFSTHNLEWLSKSHSFTDASYKLEVGDATAHRWQPGFQTVACEAYLGRPFAVLPPAETLNEVSATVDVILKKFLVNLAAQTHPGFRAVIAVPAWKLGRGFRHLKTLDHLKELGYTRSKFVHVEDQDLIYYRPGQVVGRELIVLQRT